jgi:cytochrome c-type biogenesis protein CcmH
MIFEKNLSPKIVFLITSLLLIISFNVYSVEPEEKLVNKEYELRARNISKNVRCMICQNQSIDESNAPLAKDLRVVIRNKIKEGKEDKEIYKFLTDRYGDFILLNPPLKLNTLPLWFLPFVFIIIGILIILYHHKNSNSFEK